MSESDSEAQLEARFEPGTSSLKEGQVLMTVMAQEPHQSQQLRRADFDRLIKKDGILNDNLVNAFMVLANNETSADILTLTSDIIWSLGQKTFAELPRSAQLKVRS